MVTAITNFSTSVLHLQRVYLNGRRLREATKQSRKFYREKKIKALDEISKYEFLFTDNYRKLSESGSLIVYPDIGSVEVNQIYISGLIAGKSFSETYREIGQAFNRILKEVQDDPTRSRGLIAAYEKELIQVYNDFGAGIVDIIRENFGNPAETSIQIDKFQTKQMKSVRKMLSKQVPKFWEAGISWAEVNLEKAKKKEEYKKPDIYIPPNEDAIDALIERNLGFIKGMTEEVKKSVLSELTEGMLRSEGIDQLVKRISRYVDAGSGKGQSRAEMIARSEVMYGLNQGTLTRFKRDNITKVQWLAGPDDRMCAICGQKNGSIYDIEKAPSLPYHPNCRCCWTPYFGKTDDMSNGWDISDKHDEFLNSNIEIAYVYDKDRNLIGRYVGTTGSVSIPNPPKDGYVVHNHPKAETAPASFSDVDIVHAIKNNASSYKVVSQELGIEYTISKGENGWPDPDKFQASFDNGLKGIRAKYEYDKKSGMSTDEAYENLKLSYNDMVRRACIANGIKYTEVRI
ncbi:MAG: minor capsid protein [Methanospirillum sp.]|uniref:minor capsid protein n=1 Tax=Methanospirillum sp. TaxID=45200 RepID=UPI0023754173|nr:minor capsid protein [Methanospirillum sp.]MDD1729827.1 minor capsid protein [Methanospirillum sp.]